MKIRVWVLGMTANGPDLFDVLVVCTQEDYDEGIHYEVAKTRAADVGYEQRMIAFDENDPAAGRMT